MSRTNDKSLRNDDKLAQTNLPNRQDGDDRHSEGNNGIYRYVPTQRLHRP